MGLASLSLTNLRSIAHAKLDFGPRLNLVFGSNGSGKTSILEGAFLAGRGRSFRTRHTDQLISRGQPGLTIFAETIDPAHRVGFEYRRNESYGARLDGRDVESLAELPGAFFVEAIDPQIHRLVEGSPGERRRWLDWGVFHVEPSFLEQWLRFTRALRQRNAALKTNQDARAWDAEVATYGERIAQFRSDWFETLKPHVNEAIHYLSGMDVEAIYYRGWGGERTLAQALGEGLERDRTRGATLSGPQRADVFLKVGGRAARESLSRGQQKLVASAMVLALLAFLRERNVAPPTLLLDDPAAELDTNRLGRLVDLVSELGSQLIVTALNSDMLVFGKPEHVFHVEQGTVQRL
ncbi:MAG TPA: DNA replication/repair protein RecF [Steroidobacteraceae bacterium]|nr:DNA replication/repair protein RecF [Steroidobacteraceae bacterium]